MTLDRRDYPLSESLDQSGRTMVESQDPPQVQEYIRLQGVELIDFLMRFSKQEETAERSVILVGWSYGAIFLQAVLAGVSEAPQFEQWAEKYLLRAVIYGKSSEVRHTIEFRRSTSSCHGLQRSCQNLQPIVRSRARSRQASRAILCLGIRILSSWRFPGYNGTADLFIRSSSNDQQDEPRRDGQLCLPTGRRTRRKRRRTLRLCHFYEIRNTSARPEGVEERNKLRNLLHLVRQLSVGVLLVSLAVCQ